MQNKEFLKSFSEKVQAGTKAEKVYGEPIEAHGKTVIPVAEATYGMGGLFGNARPNFTNDSNSDQDAVMGVGVRLKPIGVLEISNHGTRFIPIRDYTKLLTNTVSGFLIGWALKRIFSRKG